MNLPDYSTYSFRQLYEALDQLHGDRYPQVLAALEAEIDRRQEVEKPLLEEAYFRLDRARFPEHEQRLRARIEALGGLDSIAPETVTAENRFHTGWRRFWALVFDGIILTVIFMLGTALVLSGKQDDLALRGAVSFGQEIVSTFYFILMHAACGQTLGKMITGVRVVRNADFAPISLLQALLRDVVPLLLLIVGLVGIPYFDIGIAEGKEAALQLPKIFFALIIVLFAWPLLELITMLFNRRRRAIHDFIAGTVVIRYLRKPAKSQASSAKGSVTAAA